MDEALWKGFIHSPVTWEGVKPLRCAACWEIVDLRAANQASETSASTSSYLRLPEHKSDALTLTTMCRHGPRPYVRANTQSLVSS